MSQQSYTDLESALNESRRHVKASEQKSSTYATFGAVIVFCVAILVIVSYIKSDVDTYYKLRGYCSHIPAITADEYQLRKEKLRDQLMTDGVAAFVTEPGPTMTYLLNIRWSLSERPFLLIVLQNGDYKILCPAFERGRAVERLRASPFPLLVNEITTWEENQNPYAVARDSILKLEPGSIVAVEPETRYMIPDGLQLAMPETRVVDGLKTIRQLRMVKSEAELNIMRCVSQATKLAIRTVADQIKLGKTEAEISSEMNAAFVAASLRPEFHLVAFGANAAVPHGTSNKLTLEPDMLILIDAGATLHGYQSDVTRTFAFSSRRLTEHQIHVWETVRRAQQAALDIIKPGVKAEDLDKAARDVIVAEDMGQYFTHRLGHGIGLQGHEEAYIVNGNDILLQENMTFTVEPGIYIVDDLGVRIEDVVRVTADGYEVLGPVMDSLDEPIPIA